MKKIPKVKIKDLEGNEKKIMLLVIRYLCQPISKYMGIDATEEAVIDLIDNGTLKVCLEDVDGSKKYVFYVYDEDKEKYVKNKGCKSSIETFDDLLQTKEEFDKEEAEQFTTLACVEVIVPEMCVRLKVFGGWVISFKDAGVVFVEDKQHKWSLIK